MRILNVLLGGAIDVLLYPFRDLAPLIGLTVVSVLTGIAMLLVFRATSNQEGIVAAKRRISAGVFEIRLFNDNPRAILRAQVDIFRHTLGYLSLTTVPLLWMIAPLVLVIIQLQFHYGYDALEPGSTTIVEVKLRDSFPIEEIVLSLEGSSGVRIESPMLWIPAEREANWRIAAMQPGEHQMHVRVRDEVFGKSLRVSGPVARRSPVRPLGFFGQLLHPVEAPLPADGPIESIAVTYPERLVSFFGWGVHWIFVFFVLTMIAAFALQRPFKVSI